MAHGRAGSKRKHVREFAAGIREWFRFRDRHSIRPEQIFAMLLFLDPRNKTFRFHSSASNSFRKLLTLKNFVILSSRSSIESHLKKFVVRIAIFEPTFLNFSLETESIPRLAPKGSP